MRAPLVPLATAAARALGDPARLRERGCAGPDGLAGAGGDARRAEQLLQKEVELARCDRLHNSQPVRVLRKSPAGRCVVYLKYRPRFRADVAVTDRVAVDVYDRRDFVTGTTEKNLFAEVELCAVDRTLLNLDT